MAPVSLYFPDIANHCQEYPLRFDKNHDRTLDVEAARAAAREQVQRERVERPVAPAVEMEMMVDPRERGRPFLLSAIPEETLLTRYSRHVVRWLAAFFLFGICAIWMIGVRVVGH